MKSINLPALLLGIWLVWYALPHGIHTSLTSFGLFSLITGIVWLIYATGIIGWVKSHS